MNASQRRLLYASQGLNVPTPVPVAEKRWHFRNPSHHSGDSGDLYELDFKLTSTHHHFPFTLFRLPVIVESQTLNHYAHYPESAHFIRQQHREGVWD